MYHTREVYNILDFIGDVGGLLDGIQYFFKAILFIVSLFGYNPLADYLIGKLFE